MDNLSLTGPRHSPFLARARFLLALLALSNFLGGCVPAYEGRLRSLREGGDFSRADRLLQSAEAHRPEDPIIARERGILAFEQGKHEEAITLLERAATLDREDGRGAIYIAAASERAGRWSEAGARYRRAEALWEESPELRTPYRSTELGEELSCRRQAVEARSVAELVESKLAAERTSTLPREGRILFLPFAATGGDAALSLRLGFAALLAGDWGRTPAAEPVPFAELLAFLDALDIPLDGPIDPKLRDRLADLTGARYVVDGRLSELNEIVAVAAIFIDREGDLGPLEQRLEYQEARIGTLVDLEHRLLFQLISAQNINLNAAQGAALSEVASGNGQTVLLYGEALRLLEAGDTATATERLNQAVTFNTGFRPAREKLLLLSRCRDATAGDPERLISLYESGARAEEEAMLQRQLLSETTHEAGRLGGPEGEGKNLSLNRPVGAGSVGVSVPLPR